MKRKAFRVSDEDLQEFIARYDAGIRRTDDAIGGFLDFLDQRGLLETTLIVLTSDHGEEFLEHDRFGHFQIFLDPNLRVPLAFRLPGSPGRVFEETVELTDIIPTVRQVFGLPPLAGFVGRDLSPQILSGARPDPSRVAYSQSGYGRGFHTVIDGRYQLLVKRDTGRAELFDLENDPQAHVNIASESPGKVAELRAVLDSRLSAAQAAGRAPSRARPSETAGTRRTAKAGAQGTRLYPITEVPVGNMKALFALTALYSPNPILPPVSLPRGGVIRSCRAEMQHNGGRPAPRNPGFFLVLPSSSPWIQTYHFNLLLESNLTEETG